MKQLSRNNLNGQGVPDKHGSADFISSHFLETPGKILRPIGIYTFIRHKNRCWSSSFWLAYIYKLTR